MTNPPSPGRQQYNSDDQNNANVHMEVCILRCVAEWLVSEVPISGDAGDRTGYQRYN
jgi:hypothetical protein